MSITATIEPRSRQRTRCTLCGDDKWRAHLQGVLDYLTDERFDIDVCQGCGLMVTRPMPAGDEIDRYYPPRYRGNRHAFTGRMRVNLRARAIESCFPAGFRGRLLDVGCGDGAFVLEMRRRGWDVCATEIDTATVETLREQGVDAKSPDEAEHTGFDRPFDAVTCWHVMEHVERPLQVAQWVRTQLKPEGSFQTSVPNIGALQARLFGRHWLHLDVPRHRYHFTSRSLRAMLERANLTLVNESCFAFEYDWFGVIQSALNTLCKQPNILFEKLTRRAVLPDSRQKPPLLDTVFTYCLGIPFAAASLPPVLLAWMMQDGASLTITCKGNRPA